MYNSSKVSAITTLDFEMGWVRRIAEGDQSAFEQLWQRYRKPVFVYLLEFLHSRATAEEVTNEVFLAVWQGAERFNGNSKVSTWIFGIARNQALQQLRRRKTSVPVSDDLSELPASSESVEESFLYKDLVRKALSLLSRDHREVVLLTFFAGFSYQDIAEIVDCPLNTVKTRMFYAKQHLKQVIGSRP